MEFIHSRDFLTIGEAFEVDCDTQCNVMLLDDLNYDAFKAGRPYRYRGGFFERLPVVLRPPHPGNWNVTLDLDGSRAQIRYSIRKVSA